MSRSLSRLIYLIGGLIILLGAIFLFLRHSVNDDRVRVLASTSELFSPSATKQVMAVWAHPDDEITSAGTLARLAHDGAKLTLVYFTHGEAAHNTGFSREQLFLMRPKEALAAGRAIGTSDVVILDYGDGRLTGADGEKAKADLAKLVASRRPSTVFSFDERVGFYGHADHAQVGRWTAEVVRAGMAGDPNYPVHRLYQATLPGPVISLARKYISAFRTHYPTDQTKGLPAPTIAVPIASEAEAKHALLDVHKSQVKVIDDVQPGGRKIPAFLYYRLFDREYFALAAER